MGKLSYTWSMDGDEYHYRGGDVSEGTWQQQCIHELEANLVRWCSGPCVSKQESACLLHAYIWLICWHFILWETNLIAQVSPNLVPTMWHLWFQDTTIYSNYVFPLADMVLVYSKTNYRSSSHSWHGNSNGTHGPSGDHLLCLTTLSWRVLLASSRPWTEIIPWLSCICCHIHHYYKHRHYFEGHSRHYFVLCVDTAVASYSLHYTHHIMTLTLRVSVTPCAIRFACNLFLSLHIQCVWHPVLQLVIGDWRYLISQRIRMEPIHAWLCIFTAKML